MSECKLEHGKVDRNAIKLAFVNESSFLFLNLQPYNPQQPMYQGQGQNQVNMIPPQAQIPNSQSQPNARNGPIYVPSNVSKVNQQQIMQQPQPVPLQQQIPNPPIMFAPPPMQQQPTQAPQAPPQPPIMNNFGHVQANGGYPAQYGSQIVSFVSSIHKKHLLNCDISSQCHLKCHKSVVRHKLFHLHPTLVMECQLQRHLR